LPDDSKQLTTYTVSYAGMHSDVCTSVGRGGGIGDTLPNRADLLLAFTYEGK
jgi:hypothetical protein